MADSYFNTVRDELDSKIATELAAVFDQIAKTAMRTAAEFSDPHNHAAVLQRIQKAHSAITLIMDDAMRGLNTAMLSAMAYAVITGVESGSRDEA